MKLSNHSRVPLLLATPPPLQLLSLAVLEELMSNLYPDLLPLLLSGQEEDRKLIEAAWWAAFQRGEVGRQAWGVQHPSQFTTQTIAIGFMGEPALAI